MQVVVFITQLEDPSNSLRLQKFFGSAPNNFFITETIPIVVEAQDEVSEANRVISSLTLARDKYPDKYVIVIKDSSVTNSTIETVTNYIQRAICLNLDSN